MAENVPNLGKVTDPWSPQSTKEDKFQETNTEMHYDKVINIKDKERILKAAKESQRVMY